MGSTQDYWNEDDTPEIREWVAGLRRDTQPVPLFEQWCADRIDSATPSPPELRRQNATLGVEDHWGQDITDYDKRMFFDVIYGGGYSHEVVTAPADSAPMSVYEGSESSQTETDRLREIVEEAVREGEEEAQQTQPSV
ncbi:MAG: hypothetical protein WC188_08690 [Candidatus Caldatribacteriota bacterium]|jgi:hypothetical protein